MAQIVNLNEYKADKTAAENAVQCAAVTKNPEAMIAMFDALHAIMVRYNKKQLRFRDFTVKLTLSGVPIVRHRNNNFIILGRKFYNDAS